jgi:transposase
VLKAWQNVVLHGNPIFLAIISEAHRVAHRGVKLFYLPAYSPDFNPIEEMFSYIKSYIRRHGNQLRAAMESGDKAEPFLFLYLAVSTVTANHAQGWFHDCGYM